MDTGLIVVIVLFFIILIAAILFAIFYSPCYQQNSNPRPHKKQGMPFLTTLRVQNGEDVLPSIAIVKDTPTHVPMNLPVCDSDYLKIERSGVYTVSYGVDLHFQVAANASVALRRRACKPNAAWQIVEGSVREIFANSTLLYPFSNTCLAQFSAGDNVELVVQAGVDQIVSIPASNELFILQPETLAFINVVLNPLVPNH